MSLTGAGELPSLVVVLKDYHSLLVNLCQATPTGCMAADSSLPTLAPW